MVHSIYQIIMIAEFNKFCRMATRSPQQFTIYFMKKGLDPLRYLRYFPSILGSIAQIQFARHSLYQDSLQIIILRLNNIFSPTYYTFKSSVETELHSVETELQILWPLLIRGNDATRFMEELASMKKLINLSQDQICFLVSAHSNDPQKYFELFVNKCLQFFNTPKSKVTYDAIVDLKLGQICIEPFYSILNSRQRKRDEEEQGRNFNMGIKKQIKHLLQQNGKVVGLLFSYACHENFIVDLLDQYLKTQDQSENQTMFQLLKTICLLQGIQQMENSQGVWKSNKKIMEKIKNQCLSRWMNFMFVAHEKLRTVVFEWMLEGKVWKNGNQQVKACIVKNLAVCHELDLGCSILNDDLAWIDCFQNNRFQWYLREIQYNFCSSSAAFRKLPKYYDQAELKFLKSENMKKSVSDLGSETGTLSIQKLNQKGTARKRTKMSQIRCSINSLADKLQLSQLYVYLRILVKQLHCSPQQIIHEQPNNNFEDSQSKSSLMKVFYRVRKAVQEYQKVFSRNLLTSEIEKMISQLPIHFNLCNAMETVRQSYPDLAFAASDGPKLDQIGCILLRDSNIHFSLLTILKIEKAQQKYNATLYNNSSEGQKGKLDIESILNINKSSPTFKFSLALCSLIQLATKSKQKKQFLLQILAIQEAFTTHTLYLNLLYFLLNLEKSQKTTNTLNSLEKIFKNIIDYYLIHGKINDNSKEVKEIQKIILTSHIEIENWKEYKKNNMNLPRRGRDSGARQQISVSQYLWNLLINAVDTPQLKNLSQHYREINYIKESLYLLHLYNGKNFPSKPSQEDTLQMYHLHQRLDPHLHKCAQFTLPKLNLQHHSKQKQHEIEYDNEWIEDIQFLADPPGYHKDLFSSDSILTQIITTVTGNTLNLRQLCEIDQSLYKAALCSHFYSFMLTGSGINEITNYLHQLNQWEISNVVIFILKTKGSQFGQETKTQIIRLFWDQLIRFQRFSQMQLYLTMKKPQQMGFEELRACIKLYHLRQNYEYVRIYSKLVHQNPSISVSDKNSLKIMEIQANYKSVLVYSAIKMISDLKKIVNSLIDDTKGNNCTLNFHTTRHFYQALRFLYEKYDILSEEEEREVTIILVKYLNLTLQFPQVDPQLIIEAMYFLLRFLISQCTHLTKNTLRQVNLEKYSGNIIQPHKNFIISNIEKGEVLKNKFIENLLLKVGQYNPIGSCWWIHSMIDHNHMEKGQKHKKWDETDNQIVEMGQKIRKTLLDKNIMIQKYLDWIKWFNSAKNGDQMKAIPEKLVSPFCKDTFLLTIDSITLLGSGKSRPSLIIFTTIKKGIKNKSRFIRKNIDDGFSGWKTQSSAANFFKQCGIVDRQVTYQIVHLCKYTILIQYISHIGTLQNILHHKIDVHSQKRIRQFQDQVYQKKQIKKLSNLYDSFQERPPQYALSNFLFAHSCNIQVWWKKYTNFVKTLAQWSYIGFVVGLGDRHTSNILIREDGKIIHIDFQYIFDSGKILPYPQWIPFRFTRAIQHSLCSIQPYGLFYSEMVKAAFKYQHNQRYFWRALSNFTFYKVKKVTNSLCERAQMKNHIYEECLQLIKSATDDLLLRDMFIGWGSYK